MHRAVHQVLEQGCIFADPLAARILGEDVAALAREAEQNSYSRRMRLFIAMRTRFAEDALAASLTRGVQQLVVLGAGLDTTEGPRASGCASLKWIIPLPRPGSASASRMVP